MLNSAKELIKHYEGFKDTAYKCPAGKLTIGYGFTCPYGEYVVKGQKMTQDEADIWLDFEINQIKGFIKSIFPQVNLTANQIEALTSFIFNIGQGAFKKSTMYKLIKKGETKLAGKQFSLWVNAKGTKLPGLVFRREDELKLYLL